MLAVAPFAASDVLRLQWLLTATDVQRKLALFFRATRLDSIPISRACRRAIPTEGNGRMREGGAT